LLALHRTDILGTVEVDSSPDPTAEDFDCALYQNCDTLIGQLTMPRIHVAFYREANGEAPVVTWLLELMRVNERAWTHCRARIELLGQFGHELRRPAADYLQDGIYELRAKQGHVQYRILYFFHGREVVVLAHALTKEDEIPRADIECAIQRMKLFKTDPKAHTYEREN
jgi:phage-related protein